MSKRQYCLRTLFAITALAGVGMGVYSAFVRPRSSQDYYQLGQEAHEYGDYTTAVRYYSRALELVDNDQQKVAIRANRAAANNKLSEHKRVIWDTSFALEMAESPLGLEGRFPLEADEMTTVALHLMRANALLETGDVDAATSDVAVVLKLQPNNKHAIFLRSVAQQMAKAG